MVDIGARLNKIDTHMGEILGLLKHQEPTDRSVNIGYTERPRRSDDLYEGNVPSEYKKGSVFNDTYVSTPNFPNNQSGAGKPQVGSLIDPGLFDSDGNKVIIHELKASSNHISNSFKGPSTFSTGDAYVSAVRFLDNFKFYVQSAYPQKPEMHGRILHGYLGGKAANWFNTNIMGKPIVNDPEAVYAEFLRAFDKVNSVDGVG